MFDLFKHLLPRGRAWNITIDKRLRQFFEGLSWLPQQVVDFFDAVYLEQFSATTQDLAAHEFQWGLPTIPGLSDADRRARLAARKAEVGSNSPAYLQAVLRAHGFDVYVHEWWTDASAPQVPPVTPVPRNPATYISDSFGAIAYFGEMGEPAAEMGEPDMEMGNANSPPGYLLVNKIGQVTPRVFTLMGEDFMEMGEPEALMGNFTDFDWTYKLYPVPTDPAKWPYVLYIGGQVFPTLATVPVERRDEFENLALRLRPAQKWLGILVNYN